VAKKTALKKAKKIQPTKSLRIYR